MSIKVAQNDFTKKRIILTPLQKLPSYVGDLGKIIVPPPLYGFPKCKKSPNLVTLILAFISFYKKVP